MSNATIGPGSMDICKRCTVQRERDIERLIADELQAHPELMNGNGYLKDLITLRRNNLNGGNERGVENV